MVRTKVVAGLAAVAAVAVVTVAAVAVTDRASDEQVDAAGRGPRPQRRAGAGRHRR